MVKAGYKQTEVGVIPDDWQMEKLERVAKLSSGTTPSRQQEDRYFTNGEFFWVKTTDLNNSILKITEEKITQIALKETGLQIYPLGTVLVAMYGGFNQIGRTGLLKIPASVNQALIAIQPKRKKLDSAYLLAQLNYRVEYWKNVASSSRKDPNITSKDVRRFLIPVPSIQEQRAIAEALSDVDALIAGLDRLIAKKRDVKTAVMQQLLTGEKRLMGENGRWKTKQVDDFGEIITGGTPSTKNQEFWNGSIPWVTPSDISNLRDIFITERMISHKGLHVIRELPPNTVLITCIASIGKNTILRMRGSCNQQINAVAPNKNFNVEFLYYLFEYNKSYLLKNAGITATLIVSKKVFSKLEFSVPDLNEQNAIARVLSDIDIEITALETRRAKTQAIKQGMMQELLTGRTRLVSPISSTFGKS